MQTLELLPMEERVFCYQLLLYYYRGDLNERHFEEWQEVIKLIKDQQAVLQNENMKKALQLLEDVKPEDLVEFEYHYNKLFIGPGRLLAPPYESSYRNFEKATMQQETMKVRNFYHYRGLQLANEGQVPDDHMQFELEFTLHLLGSEDEEQKSLYRLFLNNHLLQWSEQHGEDIINHTTNKIALAFAYLLKGLLQLEKRMIEGGE